MIYLQSRLKNSYLKINTIRNATCHTQTGVLRFNPVPKSTESQ